MSFLRRGARCGDGGVFDGYASEGAASSGEPLVAFDQRPLVSRRDSVCRAHDWTGPTATRAFAHAARDSSRAPTRWRNRCSISDAVRLASDLCRAGLRVQLNGLISQSTATAASASRDASRQASVGPSAAAIPGASAAARSAPELASSPAACSYITWTGSRSAVAGSPASAVESRVKSKGRGAFAVMLSMLAFGPVREHEVRTAVPFERGPAPIPVPVDAEWEACAMRTRLDSLPLFWRVFGTNAAVLVLAFPRTGLCAGDGVGAAGSD